MFKLIGLVYGAVSRITVWLFLLTLPLTALPLLQGSIAGVISGLYAARYLQGAFSTMQSELQDLRHGPSQFTGTETITRREYQDWHNNFHIQRLNIDWAAKLCILPPVQCGFFEAPDDCAAKKDINVGAPLVDLMFWTACSPARNRETWMYLTDTARPSVNEWDAAFDEVIMRAYADSSDSAPALHFMNCNDTGAFSCGTWLTRAPALVHFVISDDLADPREVEAAGSTYSQPLSELRPVTAQIIEFPLQGNVYLDLAADTFSSHAEQMLAVVYGNVAEQFDAFDGFEQFTKRSNEEIEAVFRQPGTAYYYLDQLTDRLYEDLMEPLGIKLLYQEANGLAYTLTSLLSSIVFIAYKALVFEYEWHVKPWLFGGDDSATADDNSGAHGNFWAGINDEAWSASLDRKQGSAMEDWNRAIASIVAKSKAAEAEATEIAVPAAGEQRRLEQGFYSNLYTTVDPEEESSRAGIRARLRAWTPSTVASEVSTVGSAA